ncbi:MAG: hypothetical protein WCX97_02545 [Candidatus Magasanikbacteria bacterium]
MRIKLTLQTIRQILVGFHSRRSRWMFGLGVLIVVVSVFFAVNYAFAVGESIAGTAVSTLGDIANGIFTFLCYILIYITGLVLRLIMFTLQFLIQSASYNNYLSSTAVQIGWVLVRDVANMFFVIILLVIAFGTILGIEQYEWKKMIGKFVMAAVLVNFSHLICGFIIDIAQVFTITFVNGIAAAAGGNIINAFHLDGVLGFASNTQPAQINNSEIFIAALGGVIFSVLALAVMIGYMSILTIRVVVLWILIVLSPLAFVFGVLPQTQKYAGQWWQQFTSNVIVAPVCVFFLWLSFATLGQGDINTELAKDNAGFMDTTQVSEDGTQLPSSGILTVMDWGNMGSFVVALAMLLVGIKVTLEIGAVGSGALQRTVAAGKGVLKWGAMNAPILGGKAWINRGMWGYSKVQGAKVAYNDLLSSATSSKFAQKSGLGWLARQAKFGSQAAYHEEYGKQLKTQGERITESVGMAGSSAGKRAEELEAEKGYRERKSQATRKLTSTQYAAKVLITGALGKEMITKEGAAKFAEEGLAAEEEDARMIQQGKSMEEAEAAVKKLRGKKDEEFSTEGVNEVIQLNDEAAAEAKMADELREKAKILKTANPTDLNTEAGDLRSEGEDKKRMAERLAAEALAAENKAGTETKSNKISELKKEAADKKRLSEEAQKEADKFFSASDAKIELATQIGNDPAKAAKELEDQAVAHIKAAETKQKEAKAKEAGLNKNQQSLADSEKELKVLDSILKAIKAGGNDQTQAQAMLKDSGIKGLENIDLKGTEEENAKRIEDAIIKSSANKQEKETIMSQGYKESLEHDQDYQEMMRAMPALYMADQVAKRDQQNTFFRARREDVVSKAAQRNIWGPQGIVTPTIAMQGVIEQIVQKEFKEMTREQIMAAHQGHLNYTIKKRKSGGKVDFRDEATAAAILRKLFENGWVDDADEAVQDAVDRGEVRDNPVEREAFKNKHKEIMALRKQAYATTMTDDQGRENKYDGSYSKIERNARSSVSYGSGGSAPMSPQMFNEMITAINKIGVSKEMVNKAREGGTSSPAFSELFRVVNSGINKNSMDLAFRNLASTFKVADKDLGKVITNAILKNDQRTHNDLVKLISK